MKTREELNELKEEVEALSRKLSELSEDEMNEVTGGYTIPKPYIFPTYHNEKF